MYISVVDANFAKAVTPVVAASWKGGPGERAEAPAGLVEQVSTGSFDGLRFFVTKTALTGLGVLGCAELALPESDWALRVDEVAFPVGAVAHLHTHSGSGWRHLVEGSLRLEADEGAQTMTQGANWFEPAGSPVRAVALQTTGVTRFVRCMAIPKADIGRSTFRLHNEADAQLPRLQLTHRHLDIPVQFEAG